MEHLTLACCTVVLKWPLYFPFNVHMKVYRFKTGVSGYGQCLYNFLCITQVYPGIGQLSFSEFRQRHTFCHILSMQYPCCDWACTVLVCNNP